ncbi:hypothetical protein MPSEU_000666800 [Mayamaea pseudoterrestris]|nr:hypothetical protein MPSEU_000666800 [Mayamaea pseudoterrestris]
MARTQASNLNDGDAGLGPPSRYSYEATQLHNDEFFLNDAQEEDQELVELERRLNEEVDEEFFDEPRKFNTLQRVIDVLGLQMDATLQGEEASTELSKNSAYKNLKKQQEIVEGAIEHMAVIHCADLNGSVIQVGRVARQFSEAVSKVRTLRKQVRDIQDTLGASTQANSQVAVKGGLGNRPQNAAAMSLRELWLKKLECEATLAVLEKLDVIRAAPYKFDQLIRPPCRIGAAVLTLSHALETMFQDDVAQVQALHKIMEQLMLRKQKAEEIIWDSLSDVVYLRTGNGLMTQRRQQDMNKSRDGTTTGSVSKNVSSARSVGSESRTISSRVSFRPSSSTVYSISGAGIANPFVGGRGRFAVDEDLDDASVNSEGSGASLFSLEDSEDMEMDSAIHNMGQESRSKPSSAASANNHMDMQPKKMMIPIPMIEAELDLEADERRCIEEITLSGMVPKLSGNARQRQLPRYADSVLALRILVECLHQLKRLDDVERIMGEGLEREIRRIVQREQARTYARLERKHVPQMRSAGQLDSLKEFRRHLTGLLSAFGCVQIRLSHLAEILRLRIGSDKELVRKMGSPASVMRSVLTQATVIMQREITTFIKACLNESDAARLDSLDQATNKAGAYESGLFTLGIVETGNQPGSLMARANASRSNVMEMTTTKFVTNVLFPKTKSSPQIRHALIFRRSVAYFSQGIDGLKKELAALTGEDTSAASFARLPEEPAIEFLDRVIQKDLLPVLQEEAINGTVNGLERRDAFDPVLDRTLYARPNSNEPQDVDMCYSCQAMYGSSGPLFLALHRLPRGGDMYLPLVAVLEHVLLTFTTRVKQQIEKICGSKTAYTLLHEQTSIEGVSIGTIFERRRPFSQLLKAYGESESLLESASTHALGKQSGISPLAPPVTDTSSRLNAKAEPFLEDLPSGVEGEEIVLEHELKFLKKYLTLSDDSTNSKPVVCSDEELMKASCLAHSLLKLTSMLDSRLKVRSGSGSNKVLTSTRTLQDAIKTIKKNGIKMAMFCRLDMIMQVVSRLSKITSSSTLVAKDAVRIPSCVNDLGEYLTAASDNLREAAGNAVTAYTFSSLEQYIPLTLMQAVRVIAAGKGIITRAPLTMNGIEALDRSGSVLYRDLKGATSFDNSFWDVELAAISFERSASFMAMMELEMEELAAYYAVNQGDFTEEDFMLMFSMTGPRRKGDINRYHMMKRQKT